MPYFGAEPSSELASLDINGQKLILDADADTSITSDTDDTIDIEISGADDFQFTANTFTALSGSTIAIASGATIANSGTATGFGVSLANDTNNYVTTATGSTGLNGEANLTFDGNALTVKGTAPSITIGDADAEDAKIVFDGNAQDFHIGLDDTADSLAIGLGSTLGTTDHMVFDAAGTVTLPLQPAFLAYVGNSTVDNVTGAGTAYTIIWNIEVFDQNADYNTSNGIFTAPVTGRYHFDVQIKLADYSASITRFVSTFTSSNRNGQIIDQKGVAPESATGSELYAHGYSFLIDMDASDTCYITIACSGLAGDTVDVAGNDQPDTMFSGHLVA